MDMDMDMDLDMDMDMDFVREEEIHNWDPQRLHARDEDSPVFKKI